VGDIEIWMIFITQNSNKVLKTRKIWMERAVENMATLPGLPFNSTMTSFSYLTL
jgi:hypothetical protein